MQGFGWDTFWDRFDRHMPAFEHRKSCRLFRDTEELRDLAAAGEADITARAGTSALKDVRQITVRP